MIMKRVVSFVLFGLGSALLFGCPIYPGDRDNRACIGGERYGYPEPYYSGACDDWTCSSGADCPSGYTCNADHRCTFTGTEPPPGPTAAACTKPSDCRDGNCGADNKCHAGDCSTSGCPATFVCKLENGAPRCVPAGSSGTPSTCKSDKDCSGTAGARCLTGACVAPQDQCADATQCPGDAACVDGGCTPSCSKDEPCPAGYACDETKGVCSGNPSPCTSSNECTGGDVCVQEHCVRPCGANGACEAGLRCVDGGCTPDQQPVFTCEADGQQGGCQAGSVCVRHSCYIACDPNAGAEACKSADAFNQCKPVTTSSGTYHVCGSTSNLGTECDPTQNKTCASPLVCIDGYCR